MQPHGIHHLTAVCADARGNHAFYTRTLGMRLVKKTVNQDDVSAYHLFYADGMATPGSDLTFFDWPVGPERRGTNAIVRTGLRVAGEAAFAYWAARFAAEGVACGEVREVDGRRRLDFEDPEGQRLSLVDDGGAGEAFAWERSPVPAEHQIRGLGPVWVSVADPEPSALFLQQVLGMTKARRYAADRQDVHVYDMGGDGGAGGPAAELHLVGEPELPRALPGAGGVHHVAFRLRDEAEYAAWLERLRALRVPTSGPVDRYYFRSIYLREPGGVLFELATDGPGFAADEPLERLGERLALPPFLEGRRAAIERGLKPL